MRTSNHCCWLGWALLFVGVGSVQAHDLGFDCTRKGATLEVFAYFDDGSPAQKARVRLVLEGEKETEQAAGWTDAKGRWTLPTPPPGTYAMIVEAGAGHRARQTVLIREIVEKSENPRRVSAGPTREEFTAFPWLKVGLGLGILALLALVFVWSQRSKET